MHAALGQNAQYRLPFPFEGRLLQRFDAVVTEDAPAEHSVFALEESESVAGGPVERAVGVRDFRRVKALAREARLHRANQQRRRGHLLVLLERGLVGGAQTRRIEHRRRVDALLGHVLLEAPLEREKQARVALRFAVDEVRQDSTVLSERLEIDPGRTVFAHLFAEARPQEREGGRDAVELEVAVLFRPRTVVVVRILPPSQGQVGRAIRLRNEGFVGARALRENVRGPVFSEVEHDDPGVVRLREVDFAGRLAVFPERHGL